MSPRPLPPTLAARVAARAALAIALAATAGACSRPPPPACPKPGIVSGVESANFSASGSTTDEPSVIAYRTAVTGFGGGCAYDRSGVRMKLQVDLAGVPGPAYAGQPITFPYFVAVADAQGRVIDKQVFQATLPRPVAREAVAQRDTIEQRIAGVDGASGPSWRIYLGIDLPPEAVRQP